MIDEKKVSLMTRLSIYEKNEGKEGLLLARYFETDYVRYNVLKTWVATTFAYWLGVAIYVLLNFETLLGKINDLDYFDVMYNMLGKYVLFEIAYFLFASFVYHMRYGLAKKGLIEYNGNLRRLIELEEGLKGTVKTESAVENVTVDTPTPVKPAGETKEEVAKQRTERARGTVSHIDMLKAKKEREEEAKRQEIIANVNRLNEKREKANAEEARRQREIELEKQRIRERRRQLEEQQLRMFREQQEQSSQYRENLSYHGNNHQDGGTQ